MLITALLIYSCVATPAQIALWEELSRSVKISNYVVDGLFFIDIIVIFNSAYFDDNFSLVNDRWKLSLTYMKGWLFIDLIAILPFDLFIP